MIDMHKTMSQFASTDDYYKSIIADLKKELISMRCCGNCGRTQYSFDCHTCKRHDSTKNYGDSWNKERWIAKHE